MTQRGPVVRRTVEIRGRRVDYEAVAESLTIEDDDGTPACDVFSVTYTRTDAEAASARPVIYAWDGGPGTATATLHLALLGPRRAAVDSRSIDSNALPEIVDNGESLLDVADIVLVDAPETGFSRTAAGQDPRRFCGYSADLDVMARFVAQHRSRIGRWSSPLFLLGESYGGMRAAGIVFTLQDGHGIYPTGVALFVPVLDSQALTFSPGSELPYVMYLPTMAAVAKFHGRAAADLALEKLLAEVERFAIDEYAPALLRGLALPAQQRRVMAERLAGYIGLSADFIAQSNLRVSDARFFKELLRDQHLTLSRANPRVTGHDRDAAGEAPEHDPYTAFFRRSFGAACNSYLRDELGYATDLEYRVYNSGVLPWKFADVAENRFLFAADQLRLAMSKDPTMRVLTAAGVYDGSVPYFAVENALDRAVAAPELAANITRRRYPTDHILYLDDGCRRTVAHDLASFITGRVET